MKILIYGAGVLGSYLAHVLNRGGNDVTVLARGKRKEEIEHNGLVIRHYLQCKTTIDQVKLTESLLPEDFFDIIFVVMQYSQIEGVLPSLINNNKTKLVVFVGNNPMPEQTLEFIHNSSIAPKHILFGFQSSGGRRENGKIISIHTGKFSTLTLGSLDGDDSCYSIIEKAFTNTTFKLDFHKDMLDWLKSHVAFIMPLAYLTYLCNGNLKKAFNNRKLITQVMDAIDEGYKVLESSGHCVLPSEQVDLIRNSRKKAYLLINLVLITPLGKLAVSDHAMSAIGEMKKLSDAFDNLKRKSSIATPNWDSLEDHLQKIAAMQK